MIFFYEDSVGNIDLSLVLSVCRLLDEKTEWIIQQSDDLEKMDSQGVLDELEHILGFGIVGIQTYITDIASFAGLSKDKTFQYGPFTSNGTSLIQIINALANYWKHRSEWLLDGGGKRKEAIDRLFQEVDYSTDVEYPVSGVLTELLTPQDTRLGNLKDILIEWRNDLFTDPAVSGKWRTNH